MESMTSTQRAKINGAAACRQIDISEQTLYRWRKEYGGLKVDQAGG
jgi:transposase-like protein